GFDGPRGAVHDRLSLSQNEKLKRRPPDLDKTQQVFLWMLFLLATNTGVLLTLFRERIVYRGFREELNRFLPPNYDPKRLDYPFLFAFLTPPAWAEALRLHQEQLPEHRLRLSWLRFRKIRSLLMILEVAIVALFVVWMLLG